MKKIFLIINLVLMIIMSTSCSENKFLKDYIPSEHKYQFSTEKLREVSMKKTFNIDDYQDDARLYKATFIL
jgi:hypothetical protein